MTSHKGDEGWICLYICRFKKHYNPIYIQQYQISEIYTCKGIASRFEEQASRLSWIQHNVLKKRLER